MKIRTSISGGISTAAITVALVTLAAPGIANAQDKAKPAAKTETKVEVAEDDNVIIVSGYRQALERSISIKRDSPVVVEAFSSEDIGKLPDVSIAETLGRLPGLGVQRINGRAQSVSVRGLGPDYSNTLLNGREMVSSGDNRAVEYDQYPSELIDSGVIYKTPYSGLIGQGLAATVDLRTIRPLSKKDRIVAVSARGEFNEHGSLNPDAKGSGYRATGVYVDQFADDTLGIALGAAYMSSPTQVQRFSAWGYPSQGNNTILGGMKPYAKSVTLKRLGLFGTLEWQPSSEWNSSLDVFYSKYKEEIPLRGIEFPLAPGWGAGTTVTQSTNLNSATFTGVQPVVRNDFDQKDTTTFAAGWNTKYETDDVILSFDASYSKADRRLQQIESYAGLSYAANAAGPSDTVSYTRNSSGFPYTFKNVIDYSNTSLIQLTDPRGWGANGIVQAGFINDTNTKDDMWGLRAEAVGKVNSGFVKNLVAGFAYADRSKSRNITQNFLSLAGGPSVYASQGAITRMPIPAASLLAPTASLGFLGFGKQVTYDPRQLISNGTYKLTSVESSSLPYPGDWKVSEKVFTGYLRTDLDTRLGNVPMTGNVGVELVFTDQSSTGFASPGGIGATQTPTAGGRSYANVLPSLSLNFAVKDNMKIRFGAARTLARPRMDQLNASYNASISPLPQGGLNSIFSGGGGNPKLLPYIADGVDLTYEWYFGGGEGYLAISGYNKQLTNFINPNASVVRDFSYLVPTLTATQLAQFRASGGQTLGYVSGPDNGAKGYIRGIEGSLVLPFKVFSPSLSGFGFNTSVAYSEGKLDVTLPQNGGKLNIDVPGLSKWVVNSTVYFEKSGFEARVSHRYRTPYLAEFIGISASRDFRRTYKESIIDAQIGYRFQKGSSLDGLAITLQGLNLNNEPFISYTDNDPTHIVDYERYGRTFLVGISYKF